MAGMRSFLSLDQPQSPLLGQRHAIGQPARSWRIFSRPATRGCGGTTGTVAHRGLSSPGNDSAIPASSNRAIQEGPGSTASRWIAGTSGSAHSARFDGCRSARFTQAHEFAERGSDDLERRRTQAPRGSPGRAVLCVSGLVLLALGQCEERCFREHRDGLYRGAGCPLRAIPRSANARRPVSPCCLSDLPPSALQFLFALAHAGAAAPFGKQRGLS